MRNPRRSTLRRLLLGGLLLIGLAACSTPAPTPTPNPPPDPPPPGPAAPQVASFAPSVAARGSTIVVSGSDFGSEAGSVELAGVAASIVTWSDTAVEVTVPAEAANGWQGIELATAGGTASQDGLFVGVEFDGVGT